MAPPLDSLRAKIERTKKHVLDLQGAIRAFLDSRPYQVRTKNDPDTRKLVYYVSRVQDVPIDVIPQITADALCNMVSILDHLTYALFLKGGGGGSGRNIQFPISNASTSTEHETKCEGKVKGLPQPTIDDLLAFEAYKGGKGNDLWVLNELNNLSKHRALITVGTRFRSMNVGADVAARMRKLFPDLAVPDIPLFIGETGALSPLKVGDELFIGDADEEVNEKMEFTFDIALYESQIVHAEPLIETIHQLVALVDAIVNQFASRL